MGSDSAVKGRNYGLPENREVPKGLEASWVVPGGFLGGPRRVVACPGTPLLRCASSQFLLRLIANRAERSVPRPETGSPANPCRDLSPGRRWNRFPGLRPGPAEPRLAAPCVCAPRQRHPPACLRQERCSG